MLKESKGSASLSLSSDSKKKDVINKKDGKKKKGNSATKVESDDKDAVQTGATGEWALLEREGTINLYSGKPGSECGVMVDASSYFDRFVNLWMSASSAACLLAFSSLQLVKSYSDWTALCHASAIVRVRNSSLLSWLPSVSYILWHGVTELAGLHDESNHLLTPTPVVNLLTTTNIKSLIMLICNKAMEEWSKNRTIFLGSRKRIRTLFAQNSRKRNKTSSRKIESETGIKNQ